MLKFEMSWKAESGFSEKSKKSAKKWTLKVPPELKSRLWRVETPIAPQLRDDLPGDEEVNSRTKVT